MAPFNSISLGKTRSSFTRLWNIVLLCSALAFLSTAANGGVQTATKPTTDGVHRSVQVPLVLIWHDPYRLFPRSFDLATKEVRSIFEAMGAELRIVRGDHWDENRCIRPDELVVNVILHKATASTWGLNKWVMGAAIGNYAYVFFPDVVRAMELNPDGRSLREPRVQGLLARAVARVAAHEVVHIVVPARQHAAGGLLAAVLTRRCLTRQHLHVDPDTAAFVMDRLRPRETEGPHLVATSPLLIARQMNKQK